MAIISICAVVGVAIGVTSAVMSGVQYSKNVDRMHAQEKKANTRAEASKTREQEMAKRQLRQAAMEVGKRQLELSIAKRKKTSAMHDAQDAKANYVPVDAKPGSRPTGRPVIG